jgi:hypothetical protein
LIFCKWGGRYAVSEEAPPSMNTADAGRARILYERDPVECVVLYAARRRRHHDNSRSSGCSKVSCSGWLAAIGDAITAS